MFEEVLSFIALQEKVFDCLVSANVGGALSYLALLAGVILYYLTMALALSLVVRARQPTSCRMSPWMYYPPLPGPPSGPDDDDDADAPVWMLPMAVEIVTLAFQYLFLVVVFKLPYENWIDYGIAIYSIWLLAIGWQIYKLLDDSDVLSRGIKLLGWFLATVSLALAVAFWIRWDTEKSKVLEKKYESPASTNSRGDSVQPP